MALEGSGVGLEIGVAEPLEADGLYEKGGEVGNSVVDVPEGIEDTTEPEDVIEPKDVAELEDVTTTEEVATTEDVETEDATEAEGATEVDDIEIENVTATEVVIVAGALEAEPEEGDGREVDKVWLIVVLDVVVRVEMAGGVRPGINMEERTGRSIV
ncbi:hypothetical protein COCMIDRAFT_858 [Bipolaris oryzae ATCC 44560]|uniref:Uncharacterized protein n=1 Tax=Bipolaris oryzae ATCC 44560 TaxID=930090 RepID=W6ZEZ1_COCMI|nr:uncharacterized protein COCMIDRAFT_858 [Bipolaris oryzae ATCC 44560]EUC50402.1 hypothetical protein COCMIDRAFT_858 [Bipolaris oryzae ATCC 44560]